MLEKCTEASFEAAVLASATLRPARMSPFASMLPVCVPVLTSQNASCPDTVAVASCCPSGRKATAKTSPPWCIVSVDVPDLKISQRRTFKQRSARQKKSWKLASPTLKYAQTHTNTHTHTVRFQPTRVASHFSLSAQH